MDLLLEQPDVEITKLMHVTEDAHKHHQPHQMLVTVLQFQSKNVELTQLLKQPDVEITLLHLANKNVLHLHLLQMHVTALEHP
jgi:predicted transcriptional regulator